MIPLLFAALAFGVAVLVALAHIRAHVYPHVPWRLLVLTFLVIVLTGVALGWLLTLACGGTFPP